MPENTAALTLRGVTLSAQRPAVVVPVVTGADAAQRAAEAVAAGADVVEWRIDLALADTSADAGTGTPSSSRHTVLDPRTHRAVLDALPTVVAACAGTPLMVTYRTTAEGGSGSAPPEEYVRLLANLAAAGGVDLVDVEADHPAAAEALAAVGAGSRTDVDRLGGPAAAPTAGTDAAPGAPTRPAVVLSHHDFDRTPTRVEIVDRLAAMEEAGADVAKIAVMPHSSDDVLTLLGATAERAQDARVPLITMAMGDLGAPSRLVGGRYGSAATFASAGATSAPGQLPVGDVRAVLELLSPAR
ncbi:type I 3-dehydroquinate dehydratase [Georgenia sp. Z1491]|uniref:type I 3-dehydroquinate dehydratase n=1 Tax=Georgenia sp. Z1491 TaxID=3416707 RepID=UPI003CEDDF1B